MKQAIGTLLGTMFGFVSAALLTPLGDDVSAEGIPAAPGVVGHCTPYHCGNAPLPPDVSHA